MYLVQNVAHIKVVGRKNDRKVKLKGVKDLRKVCSKIENERPVTRYIGKPRYSRYAITFSINIALARN